MSNAKQTIVLIGLMRTEKITIGRAISREFIFSFIDTNQIIETKQRKIFNFKVKKQKAPI